MTTRFVGGWPDSCPECLVDFIATPDEPDHCAAPELQREEDERSAEEAEHEKRDDYHAGIRQDLAENGLLDR